MKYFIMNCGYMYYDIIFATSNEVAKNKKIKRFKYSIANIMGSK